MELGWRWKKILNKFYISFKFKRDKTKSSVCHVIMPGQWVHNT